MTRARRQRASKSAAYDVLSSFPSVKRRNRLSAPERMKKGSTSRRIFAGNGGSM
ncbi:hypothetical protein DP49_5589 [Burkholderia pseudomallei]|nr:hypothetical protein DP49_5589 [Burkholderia pseudomallei]